MVNIKLICNDLKNKAYYIFGKGDVKKEAQGVGARMRPCTSGATM